MHHNLKTVWWVTDHSMCRCGSTPGSELWGYEELQVHAGSWERWGHFPPPRCPGFVEKEEACLLHPLHTPEANPTSETINALSYLKLSLFWKGFVYLNWQHVSVYLSVITYCLIFQFEMKHPLAFFVISGDLCGLPYLLRIWDPNPSELKHKL